MWKIFKHAFNQQISFNSLLVNHSQSTLNIFFAIYHQSNNAFQKNLPHIHPTFDFPKLQWMFNQSSMKQQIMS